MTTVSPDPQLRNFALRGAAASAILVVTQRLLRDYGPGPRPSLVFLDLRALQLGITWSMVPGGRFSAQTGSS